MTTPRHAHSTLRALSSAISRGETDIRQLQRAVAERYQYHPQLTDAQVADAQRQIKAAQTRLKPIRAAMAALAVVIGDELL